MYTYTTLHTYRHTYIHKSDTFTDPQNGKNMISAKVARTNDEKMIPENAAVKK
jgi:hypothetical protein